MCAKNNRRDIKATNLIPEEELILGNSLLYSHEYSIDIINKPHNELLKREEQYKMQVFPYFSVQPLYHAACHN